MTQHRADTKHMYQVIHKTYLEAVRWSMALLPALLGAAPL